MKSTRSGVLTLLAGVGVVLASFVSAHGSVIYVNDDAAGANNGSSWANAYTDLQTALAAAVSGDEIWVAAGTYKPSGAGGDRAATFQLKDGVGVYGGFAGTEILRLQRNWAANIAILSGDLNGDDGPNFANNGENSYHVVTGSGTGSTAILDGVTVQAGNANGSQPKNYGGGMYNSSGSPTVTYCTFSGNSAERGEGPHHFGALVMPMAEPNAGVGRLGAWGVRQEEGVGSRSITRRQPV